MLEKIQHETSEDIVDNEVAAESLLNSNNMCVSDRRSRARIRRRRRDIHSSSRGLSLTSCEMTLYSVLLTEIVGGIVRRGCSEVLHCRDGAL